MEYVQKYWYVVVFALVALFFLSKRNDASMVQVSGSDETTLALAQMSSAERQADLDRQYGFAASFLNYDINLRGLDLQKLQLAENSKALVSQNQLSQLAYILQQQQFNQQIALQRYATERAFNAQRRQDFLGAITSGVQSFLPMLFGASVSPGMFGGGGAGGGNILNSMPGLFGGSGNGMVWH